MNDDIRKRGTRKPDFALHTGEAVDLPAFADTEFVFNGAILSKPFGGGAEFLSKHFKS